MLRNGPLRQLLWDWVMHGVAATEARARARATLEMDLQERAPEGTLTFAGGRRLSFAGWTELASVIEEWRTQAREIGSGANREREQTR